MSASGGIAPDKIEKKWRAQQGKSRANGNGDRLRKGLRHGIGGQQNGGADEHTEREEAARINPHYAAGEMGREQAQKCDAANDGNRTGRQQGGNTEQAQACQSNIQPQTGCALLP